MRVYISALSGSANSLKDEGDQFDARVYFGAVGLGEQPEGFPSVCQDGVLLFLGNATAAVAAVEANGVGDSGHGVYLLFDSEAVCHRPVPVAAAGFPGGVVMFALPPGKVNGYVCQGASLFQSCSSSASCRANSSMIS